MHAACPLFDTLTLCRDNPFARVSAAIRRRRAMRITPLQPHLAARVEDVDLAAPLDERAFQEIDDAFQEHSVLVFHDQRITDAEQMAFSRRFGPLETTIKAPGKENRYDK